MKRIQHLLCLGLLWCFAAQVSAQSLPQAWDSIPVVVASQSPLLRTPDFSAEVLAVIPEGTTVWLLGEADENFLRVRHAAAVGYLYGRYPDAAKAAVISHPEPNSVAKPAGTTPNASGSTWDISVSKPSGTSSTATDCPTVQCTGTTQKGPRCRNMTKNCNGRCHYH